MTQPNIFVLLDTANVPQSLITEFPGAKIIPLLKVEDLEKYTDPAHQLQIQELYDCMAAVVDSNYKAGDKLYCGITTAPSWVVAVAGYLFMATSLDGRADLIVRANIFDSNQWLTTTINLGE